MNYGDKVNKKFCRELSFNKNVKGIELKGETLQLRILKLMIITLYITMICVYIYTYVYYA